MKKGHDIKLNVRPIFTGLLHKYFYEGPCRFGKGDALKPEFDPIMLQQIYKQSLDEIRANMPEEVNLMEPIILERTDDWETREELFERMAKDIDQVDLFFLKPAGMGLEQILIEFAERHKKPMTMYPKQCCGMSTYGAALSARGIEFHPSRTWEELIQKLKVLRVRKVLTQTRMLLASRFNSTVATAGANDSFIDLGEVSRKLGTRFRYINLHELLDHMSPAVDGGFPTTPGRMYPCITEEDLAQADKLADELLADANEVAVSREYLLNSILAHINVKKHLEFFECNAFTIPCADLCSTRRINQMKFTFCLNHSLMQEEGIPSACEYDVKGALAMMVLMNLSYKAPYLGNTQVMPIEKDGTLRLPLFMTQDDMAGIDNFENLYVTHHSTPNRKLKGIHEKAEKIGLRHFAFEQQFGAVMRYDFRQDVGQTVTMTQFSSDVTKIFVGKGTIVGGGGLHKDNCNCTAIFRVEDQKKFFEAQCLFGNHLPLVYGDYTEELTLLGKSLGLEVVSA